MRVLLLLGVFLLTAGCGNYLTLEELEEQALTTGDWSAVEKRERIIAKRKARRALNCPAGYMAYCETMMANKKCTCVNNDIMASVLYGR
ncbi:MAG: hypothetical protein R3358_12220 [Woeseiaceae bacterium]|nr:hypothetical protein [Woeseiaceae bacterium]